MGKKVLLIDADVPCYHFAFKNQTNIDWDDDDNESIYTTPENVVPQLERWFDWLMEELSGDEIILALSDSENFRKELEPTYKANRKAEKPELWGLVRDYLENGDHGYPVKIKPRLEGDDVLGIMATHPRWKDNHVVVTIDKDLQTVPCNLFLYNKPELGVRTIYNIEAKAFFLSQVLTGDVVDGYKGLPGVGTVRAKQIMNTWPEHGGYIWNAIVAAYESKGLTEDDAIHQARLAYILQYGDYNNKTGEVKLWTP